MLSRNQRLLSVKELAECLGVPRSWVYRKAELGELPSMKIGKYVKFSLEAVAEHLGIPLKAGE